jgi:hypothetical protein
MIQPLRERAEQAFSEASTLLLASSGPAGLQCEPVNCLAEGLRLYLLVPRSSDQLLNLEQSPQVLLTTEHWQLRASASILAEEDIAPALRARAPRGLWAAWVVVQPYRMQIRQPGSVIQETIDFA